MNRLNITALIRVISACAICIICISMALSFINKKRDGEDEYTESVVRHVVRTKYSSYNVDMVELLYFNKSAQQYVPVDQKHVATNAFAIISLDDTRKKVLLSKTKAVWNVDNDEPYTGNIIADGYYVNADNNIYRVSRNVTYELNHDDNTWQKTDTDVKSCTKITQSDATQLIYNAIKISE